MIPQISRKSGPTGLLLCMFGRGAGATSTAASIDMRNGLVLNCRPARSFRELDDAFDRRYLHRLARWSGIRRWNGRTAD